MSIPKLDELILFSDWGIAFNKYGETAGNNPSNLHAVDTTAGHEPRGLLSCAGPGGVAAVPGAVKAGSAFDEAYASVGEKCAR